MPGKPCKVRVTATAGGSAVRIWCTAAPPGSAERKKLDESGAERVAFQGNAIEAGKDFDFTPAVGGGYVLTLDEIAHDKPAGTSPGFGGAYEGDTRGAKRERIQASEPATLWVAEPVNLDLGVGGDTATVQIHTWQDRVIRTSKDVQGVATPAVIRVGSPRAKIAAESSDVRAAVVELAADQLDNEGNPGPPVATFVIGSLSTSIGNVVRVAADQYEDHVTRTQSHAAVDNDNVLDEDYTLSAVDSVSGQAEALTKLLDGIGRHIRNANPDATDNPGGTSSASPAYHRAIGWASLPMAGVRPSVGNPASIFAATAEYWRVHEAHRQDADAHEEADNTNRLGTPSRLLDLHIKFMTELASIDPAAGPTVNSGTTAFLAAGAKTP